jgi:D-alanyl-D-alanine carboxypeptidase (penicillin-binding protein 5/6)
LTPLRPPGVRAAGLLAVLVVLICAAPAAAKPAAPPAPPNLDARAWILIDARTGDVLDAHAPARELPIASTTKLMTAHLALEQLRLSKRVVMAPYSAIPGESLLGIQAGTRISVHDLLYSLILESANDSAYTLSRAIAHSEPRFVGEMNRAAAALGLADTHYENPIGLDAAGNYSSARDLATLSRDLLHNRVFARIADTTKTVLHSLHPPPTIYTRNTLLLREPWVTGVKTGHTLGAGYVLVGSARKAGTDLISVVLGADSETERDLDSLRLLDYGFAQYRPHRAIRPREQLAQPSIRYSGGMLPLVASRPVVLGTRRGQQVLVSVQAPGEVTGPLPRGRRLGRATVTVDGRQAAVVPLLTSRSIPAASTFDKLRSNAILVAALLVALLFVILLVTVLLRRRRSGDRRSEEETRAIRDRRQRMRDGQNQGGTG